jgi:hypothetical protein
MINDEAKKLARQWAKCLKNGGYFAGGEDAAADVILSTIGLPTVAETGWDAKDHPMQGADTPFGRLVMVGWDDSHEHPVIGLDEGGSIRYMSPELLTPVGVWYELKELG